MQRTAKKIFNPPAKKYTLASRTRQRINQSLQESIFFSSPNRNLKIFSPTLRCFNFFFHRTVRNRTDIASIVGDFGQSVSKLDTKHLRTDSTAAANKGLPKAGVTNFYDSFVFNRTLVFQMNGSAEIPRLRQYPNRYAAL